MNHNRLSIPLNGGPADGATALLDVPADIRHAVILANVRGHWYVGRPAFASALAHLGPDRPAAGVVVTVISTTDRTEAA